MARKGRELEILISRIEKELNILSGNNVTIKSPDYILDHSTQSLREVDASICYNIGSVPIIITIECRDRPKSNEDVIWIEQLIQKKKDLGISNTIAVSSKGFSPMAHNKAKINGIETRTFKEISENNLDWLKDINVPREALTWSFEKLQLILEGPFENIIIDEKINKEIIEDNGYAVLSEDKNTGEKIILNEIATEFIATGQFPKIPGIIGIGEVKVSPDSQFYIPTNKGNIRLLGMKINIKIEKSIPLEEPLIKIFEYKSEDKTLIKMAKLEYGNFEINLLKS